MVWERVMTIGYGFYFLIVIDYVGFVWVFVMCIFICRRILYRDAFIYIYA